MGDDQAPSSKNWGICSFRWCSTPRSAPRTDAFEMADILQRLCDKMTRRHPHVFGDTRLADAPRPSWPSGRRSSSARASRTGGSRSVLDGVPRALPALTRAQRMQSKAARVKFDWPDAAAAWAKVEEEMDEARGRPGLRRCRARRRGAGGPALLRRQCGAALRRSTPRPRSRARSRSSGGASRRWKRHWPCRGRSVSPVDQGELERSWEATKARERQG